MTKVIPPMDSTSTDIVADNINKLKELFPEAFTEGKVDFDALKEVLGEYIDGRDERYSFTWNGKSKARMIAQTPSTGTLRPCKEESVDWDTTQNLFIEGDNLEVLKLLQKSYHKKVKMIYIDPPYNTGKDFVYKDNFKDNIKNYKEITGQVDGEGRNLSSNPETSGRYHTDWLNMMYPRLKLARSLLKDDGIIAVSIDDNEIANLLKLLEEIMGEHIKVIAVKMSEPTGVKMASVNREGSLAKLKEYIVFAGKQPIRNLTPEKMPKPGWDYEYATVLCNITKEEMQKIKDVLNNEERTHEDLIEIDSIVSKITTEGINRFSRRELGVDASDTWLFENAWRIVQFSTLTGGSRDIAKRKKKSFNESNLGFFTIVTPKNKCYLINGDFNDEVDLPRCKVLFADDYLELHIGDFWQDIKTTGLDNEGFVPFKNGKKPIKLLNRIFDMVTKQDDIVLDFFGGSGSSAEAVMKINKNNRKNLKFIIAQLPEILDSKNKEQKESYSFCKENSLKPRITELAKERLRRAAAKIKAENPDYNGDLGFKTFKLDSTNIKPWELDFDLTAQDLEDQISNIKPDRKDEDVLYEVLLKYGLDLTLPITEHSIDGHKVFNIGMGALIVCLSDKISLEVAEGIAKLKDELNPEIMRVVFKDAGFTDDIVKTNALQILKQAGIEDVRSL